MWGYFYPAFEENETNKILLDEYAFRPTDSTTSALVSLLQQTTEMLKENDDYIAIVSLNLSKVFDAVRQATIVMRLASIPIPDEVYNWVVEFLSGRSYVTLHQRRDI